MLKDPGVPARVNHRGKVSIIQHVRSKVPRLPHSPGCPNGLLTMVLRLRHGTLLPPSRRQYQCCRDSLRARAPEQHSGAPSRAVSWRAVVLWKWLVKACRSVAQALDHEGKRDAAGTQRPSGRWERAAPKPQPHQVTWALRVSVCPCLAHHKSAVRGDGS